MNQFEHVQEGTPGVGALYGDFALYSGKGHLNPPPWTDRRRWWFVINTACYELPLIWDYRKAKGKTTI